MCSPRANAAAGASPDFVALGGISLDWVVTAGGETSLRNCGGNATYTAVGARIWTDHVAIVGRVGHDYPDAYLSDLSGAGIDICGIQRLPEAHELIYAVRFDAAGERHPIYPPQYFPEIGVTDPEALEDHVLYHAPWDCEAIRHFDITSEMVPRHFWNASGFHVARMHRETEFEVASELNRRSMFFSLDSDCANCSEYERRELLRRTPAFLPSESDVKLVLDDPAPDLDTAVERLCAMGPDVVAIKRGEGGSVVFDARTGRRHHVPIFPTQAKDPTGAGDSYCGGFLVGYLTTGDVFEAALRGTVSSSFVVEEFDARYALRVSRAEAEARLDVLRKLAT
jgi:sugar/nucleoside kinase (ribokinase family)